MAIPQVFNLIPGKAKIFESVEAILIKAQEATQKLRQRLNRQNTTLIEDNRC